MKKTLLIVLGLLVVAGLGYFFSPFFTQKRTAEKLEDIARPQGIALMETSRPSDEAAPTVSEPEIVSSGSFESVGAHSARGTAQLVKSEGKYFVRLDDDFDVTNGPDLYVSFGKDGEYRSDGLLAPLKGNSGGQNYEVPSIIDVSRYDEVWIWCKRFSVGFGKAVLE